MLQIKTTFRPSQVHGRGLFLEEPVRAGTVLWAYDPAGDYRLDAYTASGAQLHHGYINPRRPHDLVVCGDAARWWNFPPAGEPANSIEGYLDAHGEAVIVAARDLAAGEELLIETGSDADAPRKLNLEAVHAW